MYVWMDGRTFKTGFINSILSNSRPNNVNMLHYAYSTQLAQYD